LDERESKRLGITRESAEVLLRKYERWKPPGAAITHGMFEVVSGREGDTVFISLSGELDYSHAGEAAEVIREAEASDASRIVISLRDVSYMDSTGLNLLLQARVRMRGTPQRLRFLRSEHQAVRELLDATQTTDALY
jgi:anti-anti-sigma factor